MSGVVWVGLQLLDHFNLFGEVFRIGVAVEIFVGGPAEPVGLGSQLIREVGVVVLCCVFGNEVIGVGGLAAEGEVAAGVAICGLNVLIFSLMAGEMR